MRRTLIAIAAGALLLAACGTDDDGADQPQPTTPPATASPATSPATPTEDGGDTASPTDTASPGATTSPDDVAAMTFTECEAERYTVGYPAEWETNDSGGIMDACEVFHPDEIDEPDQPRDRDLHYAVSMYVDPVEFDDISGGDTEETLQHRETTVDGRRALVEEFRSTGDALVPEGELRYAYTVDLDGEILVAVTHSVGETDYERDKRVLDRMITEELTIEASD